MVEHAKGKLVFVGSCSVHQLQVYSSTISGMYVFIHLVKQKFSLLFNMCVFVFVFEKVLFSNSVGLLWNTYLSTVGEINIHGLLAQFFVFHFSQSPFFQQRIAKPTTNMTRPPQSSFSFSFCIPFFSVPCLFLAKLRMNTTKLYSNIVYTNTPHKDTHANIHNVHTPSCAVTTTGIDAGIGSASCLCCSCMQINLMQQIFERKLVVHADLAERVVVHRRALLQRVQDCHEFRSVGLDVAAVGVEEVLAPHQVKFLCVRGGGGRGKKKKKKKKRFRRKETNAVNLALKKTHKVTPTQVTRCFELRSNEAEQFLEIDSGDGLKQKK